MRAIQLAIAMHPDIVLWRQNCGAISIRDLTGRVVRVFHAGPPNGAADLSGLIRPEGWRLEVETKSARGKQGPHQKTFQKNLLQWGAVYVLCPYDSSVDMTTNVTTAVEAISTAIKQKRNVNALAPLNPLAS